MTTVLSGPEQVNVFRAITMKHALQLYAKTGMKANRAYTPTAMLAVATEYTGKKYKRGQYDLAAQDLDTWIKEQKK